MALKRITIVAVAAGSLLLLGACGDDEGDGEGGGEAAGGGGIEITAEGIAYDKTSFEVDPGSEVEVTLVNNDETEHTFSIEDPQVEVEAAAGESASGSFTAPEEGTLEFFCEYHPDAMRGEITVGGTAAGGDSNDTTQNSGPYSD
jgi:plastocyanin